MKTAEKGYTVFSKSGCPNCRKVKEFLKEHGHEPCIIDCDEALLDDRASLLEYLYNCGAKGTVFPFVFLDNNFLGGYEETRRFVEESEAFNDIS